MTKLIPLIFFLSACATKRPIEKVSALGTPLVKKTTVKDLSEAKRLIQNQKNFLVLLFEQSRDPYYGTPKWSEACLKANQIGEIEETESAIILKSNLIFNELVPGFCPEERRHRPGVQLLYHCKNSSEVVDLRFIPHDEFNLKEYQLCL